MRTGIVHTIQSYKTLLLKTPLLLGWLALGPFVTLIVDGWMGLAFCLINMVLLAVYAVIIRSLTPNPPKPEPVKRPRLELILALGLLAVTVGVQLLDFEVLNIQPLQSEVRGFFANLAQQVYETQGLPDWARQDVFIALSSTIKQLIPALLLFLVLGYGPRAMGFVCPHWKLTGILVGLTAVFGLATGYLLRAPIHQTLILYFIGFLINALPEELFFRGMLLPRLEKVFANPLNALVVSALCFNLIHVSIDLYHGQPLYMALLDVFSTSFPSGLIWGYLYLRTRSILPGMFWHASFGVLGFALMSL